MSVCCRSNWNLEELVFKERGKLEYLEKNLLEERREPTTNSTQIWHRRQDSNPGHTGGDESSHHCATLPPRIFSWVWMLHYTFTCYDLYALLLKELWFLCMVSISSCFRWLWMLTSILFHQSSLFLEIYMQPQWMLFCLVDGNCK